MKKITLSVLMLGIMFMVVGSVSAVSYDKELILENKNATWQIIEGDGRQATLGYNDVGPEFEYSLNAEGLQ